MEKLIFFRKGFVAFAMGLLKWSFWQNLLWAYYDGAFNENSYKLVRAWKILTAFIDGAFCQTNIATNFQGLWLFSECKFSPFCCREKDIFPATPNGVLKIFHQNLCKAPLKELIIF